MTPPGPYAPLDTRLYFKGFEVLIEVDDKPVKIYDVEHVEPGDVNTVTCWMKVLPAYRGLESIPAFAPRA